MSKPNGNANSANEPSHSTDPKIRIGTLFNKLKISFLNIQGLISTTKKFKVPMLRDLMDKSRSNLLIVTESHLNNIIVDAEIQMEGYDLIRGDRKERSHGGVAICTSSNIISETLLTFSNTVCELVIMKLPQINHILVTIYRPPDTNYTEFREMINTLLTTLRVLGSPLPDIGIFGDLTSPM